MVWLLLAGFLLMGGILHAQTLLWHKTSGPSGMRVYSIAVSGGGVVVGSPYGLFRSTNDGSSWTKLNDLYTQALASGGAVMFAELYPQDTGSGKLYRSMDHGASWTQSNTGLPADIYSLCTDGKTAFAGDGIGRVWRSLDTGNSWSQVLSDVVTTQSPFYYRMIALHGDYVFAASDEGMYRSTDNGMLWERSDTGMSQSLVYSVGFDGGLMFAGTADGIYFSNDKGATWTRRDSGFRGSPVTIVQDRMGSTTLFAGLRRSTDHGTTWTPIDSSYRVLCATQDLGSGPKILAVTTSGYPTPDEIYRSTDNGDRWSRSNAGLSYPLSVSSLTSAAGNLFAVAGYYNTYRSTDGGARWTPSYARGRMFASSGSTVYLDDIKVLHSSDDGASWNWGRDSGWSYASNEGTCLGVTGSTIFAGDGSVLNRSLDGGNTWKTVLKASGLYGTIAINGSHVLVASQESATHGGIYRSMDNGDTWDTVDSRGATALCFAGGNLFVGRADGIYRSGSNGGSWEHIEEGLSVQTLLAVGDTVYLGSSSGAYHTTNSGETWNRVSSGLLGSGVTCLTTIGTTIYAGTENGVYSADRTQSSVAPIAGDGEHEIFANPNPARDELSLHYPAIFAGAEIAMFNSLGQRVLTTHSDATCETIIDVKPFAPGIYSVRINAALRTSYRKIVIVR